MTARSPVILSAAVCLLLASGHTIAQAPPVGPDYDKRLKALEDKMDRVLKLLEAREAPPLATDEKAFTAARDKLRAELDAARQRYSEFRHQNPFVFFPGAGGTRKIYAERLGKIETKRAELKVKLKELEDRLSDVEKAYDGGKNRFAALRLLVGPTVAETTTAEAERTRDNVISQLSGERRKLAANLGEKAPAVREADDAIALTRKTYAAAADAEVTVALAALRTEVKRTSDIIESLTSMFDTQAKQLHEINAFETQDERFRGDVDRLGQELEDIEKRLSGGTGRNPK
jgi:DNA repair exonuclease SbcCD ATPase subunit